MKKNIWSAFSLIGFMFLFFECAIKTIIKCIKERNFSLWLSLLAKVLLWWFGLIMLPAGIASIFIEKVSAFNYILGNGYSILILVYIYVVGLFITRKLYGWKTDKLENNFLPSLDTSENCVGYCLKHLNKIIKRGI